MPWKLEVLKALAMPSAIVGSSLILGYQLRAGLKEHGGGLRDGLSLPMTAENAGRQFMEVAFKEVNASVHLNMGKPGRSWFEWLAGRS